MKIQINVNEWCWRKIRANRTGRNPAAKLPWRKNFSEKDWRFQANAFHVKEFLHAESALAKAFARKRQ